MSQMDVQVWWGSPPLEPKASMHCLELDLDASHPVARAMLALRGLVQQVWSQRYRVEISG